MGNILQLTKKTRKITTCNQLDLGALGSRPIMPQISPWTLSVTAPNMIFSVTYYLDLHGAISLYCYQVKLSMFYNVLTTNLTFVGQI